MIGDILKSYRKQNHISQAQMASKLKVSPSYISSLERGVRNAAGRPYLVSHTVLEKMSKELGIPVDDLEKEAAPKTDLMVDPLTDEEADIIKCFRKADAETKAMIRRLVKYIKNENGPFD